MKMKKDKNGLLYLDKDYFKNYNMRQLYLNSDTIVNSYFYEIPYTSDYILKYKIFPFNKDKLIDMLTRLRDIQKNINDIDFPIGYYTEDNEIMGQIIKYYKDSPSLEMVCKTK